MKATITLGACCLALAGCGSARMVSAVPVGCAATTAITVEHGPGRLVMMPECINVTEGASVNLSFSPPATRGAKTKYRGIGNRWLDRRNDEGDRARIVVAVPPGAAGDGDDARREYKYEIHVEGVGILDPRIVVER